MGIHGDVIQIMENEMGNDMETGFIVIRVSNYWGLDLHNGFPSLSFQSFKPSPTTPQIVLGALG